MGRKPPEDPLPASAGCLIHVAVYGYMFSGVDLSRDGNVREHSRCEVMTLNFHSFLFVIVDK